MCKNWTFGMRVKRLRINKTSYHLVPFTTTIVPRAFLYNRLDGFLPLDVESYLTQVVVTHTRRSPIFRLTQQFPVVRSLSLSSTLVHSQLDPSENR